MWSRVILYPIKFSLTSKFRLLLFRVMRTVFSWIPYVCGAKFLGIVRWRFSQTQLQYRPVIPPHQQRKAFKKKKGSYLQEKLIFQSSWQVFDELRVGLKNQFVKQIAPLRTGKCPSCKIWWLNSLIRRMAALLCRQSVLIPRLADNSV